MAGHHSLEVKGTSSQQVEWSAVAQRASAR